MPVVTTAVNGSMPPFYVIAMDRSGQAPVVSGSVRRVRRRTSV
jgi:hypothetical protein